jgi:hypothetical protein
MSYIEGSRTAWAMRTCLKKKQNKTKINKQICVSNTKNIKFSHAFYISVDMGSSQ